jgi:hypothetical protein
MNLKLDKRLIAVIGIICTLTILSCQKSTDKDALTDAVITGFDIRDCVCCGGLMINFKNDPLPYSGEFYLVNELPPKPVIDNNTKFPLYVRVLWKYNDKVCGGAKFIDITKLEIK